MFRRKSLEIKLKLKEQPIKTSSLHIFKYSSCLHYRENTTSKQQLKVFVCKARFTCPSYTHLFQIQVALLSLHYIETSNPCIFPFCLSMPFSIIILLRNFMSFFFDSKLHYLYYFYSGNI